MRLSVSLQAICLCSNESDEDEDVGNNNAASRFVTPSRVSRRQTCFKERYCFYLIMMTMCGQMGLESGEWD